LVHHGQSVKFPEKSLTAFVVFVFKEFFELPALNFSNLSGSLLVAPEQTVEKDSSLFYVRVGTVCHYFLEDAREDLFGFGRSLEEKSEGCR
jgi:hypothetical protein